MKVAIVGAAGSIGRTSTTALNVRQVPVRLVGRNVNRLEDVGSPADERVAADVETYEGCVKALTGVDAALYALGLPYTKREFAKYPDMARHFLAAAKALGVKKVILISNVYPYGLSTTARVAEDHSRNPVSVKGEWRKQQEDIFLAAQDPNGVQVISLRLPNFYGPSANLSIADGMFSAAVRGKRTDLLGPVDLPQELIFAPDVGPVVADLFQNDAAFGQAYNLGGAGTLTWREFATAIYQAAGHPFKARIAGPTMLKIMGVFSELMRELGEMSYLQTHPVLLNDDKLLRVLPTLRKTPYAEGIRQTVAAYAKDAAAQTP